MNRPLSLFRFIDGPLMDQDARRSEVVRRMAKDLSDHNAFSVRDDAIDVLMHCGYPTLDIFGPRMVDDAMQVAYQRTVNLVDGEMGKP